MVLTQSGIEICAWAVPVVNTDTTITNAVAVKIALLLIVDRTKGVVINSWIGYYVPFSRIRRTQALHRTGSLPPETRWGPGRILPPHLLHLRSRSIMTPPKRAHQCGRGQDCLASHCGSYQGSRNKQLDRVLRAVLPYPSYAGPAQDGQLTPGDALGKVPSDFAKSC